MASKVDICNMAVSHVGDRATIASIDPPDGTPQAMHCAVWYNIARRSLLEMHNWSFAMTRVTPAQLECPWPEWDYAYQVPNDSIQVVAVLPTGATNDYSESAAIQGTYPIGYVYDQSVVATFYTPQPYAIEKVGDVIVVYTDVADAVIRYTQDITDTTLFSALFTECLSYRLGALIAGPILKGDTGRAESKRLMQMLMELLKTAAESDSSNRSNRVQHVVGAIAARTR